MKIILLSVAKIRGAYTMLQQLPKIDEKAIVQNVKLQLQLMRQWTAA